MSILQPIAIVYSWTVCLVCQMAAHNLLTDVTPEQLTSTRPGINGHAPSNGGPPNANLYPWSKRRLNFTTSQPNPFPRYGAAVNATSSKEGDVYVMGGLVNGSTVKGDLWMIEAGVGNLACYPIGTKSEGPGPRVGHASLLVGNAFIVFGGDTKQEETDPLDDTLYLLNTCESVQFRPGGVVLLNSCSNPTMVKSGATRLKTRRQIWPHLEHPRIQNLRVWRTG